MSHEFEQGFSVREPSWHGLATVLDDYPGRDEAMRIAGHDFVVLEKRIGIGGFLSDDFDADEPYVAAPGFKALVKSTEPEVIFQMTPLSYGVVQNNTLWDIIDALVDEPNVKYETAGILRKGKVLWVLAKLDEPTRVNGDDSLIFPYVCVSTTHDGSGATRADSRSIRTICMNTYSAGLSESNQAGTSFTFRHTKNVNDKIEDAKLALKGVRVEHAEFMALAEDLGKVKLTPGQRELFVSGLIPMPPEAIISKKVMKNVENARSAVRGAFASKTVPEAHKFTGYGALSVGVEYLDHLRAYRSNDSYFGRSMLKVEPAKVKLAKLVREVAKA